MILAINPNCCFPNPRTCYSWPIECPTDSAHPWTEDPDPVDDVCHWRYSLLTLAGVVAGSGTTTINGDGIPTALNKLFRLENYGNLTTSLKYGAFSSVTWNVVHNGVSETVYPEITLDFDDGHPAKWTCNFGTIGSIVFKYSPLDHDQITKTGASPGVALTIDSSSNGYANFGSASANGLYAASIFDYSSSTTVSGDVRWGSDEGFGLRFDATGKVTKLLPDPLTEKPEFDLVPTNPVIKINSIKFTDTGQSVKIRYGRDATTYNELLIETTGSLSCAYDSGAGRCANDGSTYALHIKLTGDGGDIDEFTTDPTYSGNVSFLDGVCAETSGDCDVTDEMRTIYVNSICLSHLAREGKAYAIISNMGGFLSNAGLASTQYEVDANPGKFFQIEASSGVQVDGLSGFSLPTINTAGQARWFLHPAGGTPEFMDAFLETHPGRDFSGSLDSRSSGTSGQITIALSTVGNPVTGDRVSISWDGSTGATPGTRVNCTVTSLGGGSYSFTGGWGDTLPTSGFLPINPGMTGIIAWKDLDAVWLNGQVARDFVRGSYHLVQDTNPANYCHWIDTVSGVNVTAGGIGTLKSESSTTGGVITHTGGVMPADNDLIDVAWQDEMGNSGLRTGMLAHPIAGSDITISGGSGDPLPDSRYTDTVSGEGAPMMFKVQGAATTPAKITVLAVANNSETQILPSPLLPPSGSDPSCIDIYYHDLFNETDTLTMEWHLTYTGGSDFGNVHYSESRTGTTASGTETPCNTLFENVFVNEIPSSASTTAMDMTWVLNTVTEPDDLISDNVALHFHPRCSKCGARLVDSVDAIPLSTATPPDTDGRCNACKDCQFTGIHYEELLVTGEATKTYENGTATSGGESCGAGPDDDLGCPHLSSVNGTYAAWRNDLAPHEVSNSCGDCRTCAWRGPGTTVSDGHTDCPNDGLVCIHSHDGSPDQDKCQYGGKDITSPTGCDDPGPESTCTDYSRFASVLPFCPEFGDSCDQAGVAGSPPSYAWATENEWCESAIVVQWGAGPWQFIKKWRDIINPRTGNFFNENDPPPRMSDLDGLQIPPTQTSLATVVTAPTCCGEGPQGSPDPSLCAASGFTPPGTCPYCWKMKMLCPPYVTINLGRRHVT